MAEVTITDNTDEAKKEMRRRVLAALTAAGSEAEGDAKSELENDPHRAKTCRLRNSITHLVDAEAGEAYIGTNVEYAIYVHEGTGIYAESGNGRQTPWMFKGDDGEYHWTRGMKPNRFLRNAIEKNREKYKSIMENELKK